MSDAIYEIGAMAAEWSLCGRPDAQCSWLASERLSQGEVWICCLAIDCHKPAFCRPRQMMANLQASYPDAKSWWDQGKRDNGAHTNCFKVKFELPTYRGKSTCLQLHRLPCTVSNACFSWVPVTHFAARRSGDCGGPTRTALRHLPSHRRHPPVTAA